MIVEPTLPPSPPPPSPPISPPSQYHCSNDGKSCTVYSAEQLVQAVSNSTALNITLACGLYLLDTTYYLPNPADQQRNYKVGLPIGSTPDGTPTGKEPMRLTAAEPRCAVLDAAAHAGDPRSVIGIALWEVVTLEGLVIQGGFIGGPSEADKYDNNVGGGIFILGFHVELVDCLIQSNTAAGAGAGIYTRMSDAGHERLVKPRLRLTNTDVIGNIVLGSKWLQVASGAGIFHDTSDSNLTVGFTIINSTIANNTSPNTGGGIHNTGGSLIMITSIFSGNLPDHLYHGGLGSGFYIMPPPGRFLQHSFNCVEQMCANPDGTGPAVPCPLQICPLILFGSTTEQIPQATTEDYPSRCAQGTFLVGDKCISCPSNTTTNPADDSSSCICAQSFFDDLRNDAVDNITGTRFCLSCPVGFDQCPSLGTTTITAKVSSGFWRPAVTATLAKPCPIQRTCVGGGHAGGSACASSFNGTYCTSCSDTDQYFDTLRVQCHSCRNALAILGGIFGAALVIALGGHFCHPVMTFAKLVWGNRHTVRLRTACSAITLPIKLKLLLGYAQVVAQLQAVYQIRYPSGYQSLTARVFQPLRLQIFGWIPGLHLMCFQLRTLQAELLLYTLVPLGLVCAVLAVTRARKRSLMPALPFVLRVTYVLYPAVSSKGFQTLAECDCFEQINALEPLCFLRTEYSVVCPGRHAQGTDLLVGAVAVAFYGVGVPMLYTGLLFTCRTAIGEEKRTPLSDALNFLHGSLHPWALWWPLVEASRTLLLTGFLALIDPGEIFQLLCGQVVAIVFLVLQLWCAPYRTASNNFLAMAVNFSLVLNFVSSLGVQLNAMGHADVHPTLLLIVLIAATFTVFPLTLILLLAAFRQQQSAAQGTSVPLLFDPDRASGPHFGSLINVEAAHAAPPAAPADSATV